MCVAKKLLHIITIRSNLRYLGLCVRKHWLDPLCLYLDCHKQKGKVAGEHPLYNNFPEVYVNYLGGAYNFPPHFLNIGHFNDGSMSAACRNLDESRKARNFRLQNHIKWMAMRFSREFERAVRSKQLYLRARYMEKDESVGELRTTLTISAMQAITSLLTMLFFSTYGGWMWWCYCRSTEILHHQELYSREHPSVRSSMQVEQHRCWEQEITRGFCFWKGEPSSNAKS